MPKRKMVQNNLLKNSISAYFAAIEIHNKPNFSYRYETVTLLIMNAWELILKCFVKKYIKSKSIYKKDGHTISIDKAIDYTDEYINKQGKKFNEIMSSLKENNTYAYTRRLNPKKAKTTKTTLYAASIIDEIKQRYET